MAGAIAGTAILNIPSKIDHLHTVTLTINNYCNLSCPHCYLQYDGSRALVSGDVLEEVLDADFRHLAIVGKEPLANNESVRICEDISRRILEQGRTLSLITNGTGLARLSTPTLEALSYIDISLDGGPEQYSEYRGGRFDQIMALVNQALESGLKRINALHVINHRTVSHIDDMMQVTQYAEFDTVMFSPYVITQNHGTNNVHGVSLEAVMSACIDSAAFMSAPNSLLLIDTFHLEQDMKSGDYLKAEINRYGLGSKVKIVDVDPILYGILRVTYDGLVLSPRDSLNPATYMVDGIPLQNQSLNKAFDHLTSRFGEFIC